MLLTSMGSVAWKAGKLGCRLLVGEWWLTNFNFITTLVRQDLEARYEGQSSGNFWYLLNHLLQLLSYNCVFSIVLKVKLSLKGLLANQLRYGLWLSTRLLPWLVFMSGFTQTDGAMAKRLNLVKKVGVLSENDLWWQCCRFSLKGSLA